jgi:chaperone modulatory protein CbpM
MIDSREFLTRMGVEAHELEAWIASGWLLPRGKIDVPRFSEIDLARAQLVRDLQENIAVNDEGITIILDLVDQIHGLRRTLRKLLLARAAQSEAPVSVSSGDRLTRQPPENSSG